MDKSRSKTQNSSNLAKNWNARTKQTLEGKNTITSSQTIAQPGNGVFGKLTHFVYKLVNPK